MCKVIGFFSLGHGLHLWTWRALEQFGGRKHGGGQTFLNEVQVSWVPTSNHYYCGFAETTGGKRGEEHCQAN